MTTFDERERSFEWRFAHDEELRFRVHARRNRLLAGWACGRMRLDPDAASRFTDGFVRVAVMLDDDAVLARLGADLAAAGVREPLAVLRREMRRCAGLARAEGRVGLALDQGSPV